MQLDLCQEMLKTVFAAEPNCPEALILKSRLLLKTKATDREALQEVTTHLDQLERLGYAEVGLFEGQISISDVSLGSSLVRLKERGCKTPSLVPSAIDIPVNQ